MNNKNKKQQKKVDPNLVLRPAFRGQVVQSMRIEGTPLLFSSAVTTGLVNPVCQVSTASIANFSTRFGALFEEYRFVKAEFATRLFNSTSPGLLTSWVDEKVSSAPTLAESRTKSSISHIFNASAVNTRPKLVWTPHDTIDLQYTGIGTASIFATFKIYGDLANYGTGNSGLAITYGEIFPVFTIQFRGLL